MSEILFCHWIKQTYAPTQIKVTYFNPSGVVFPKVNLHMKFDDQVTYSSREIDLNAKSNQGVMDGWTDQPTDGQTDGQTERQGKQYMPPVHFVAGA